MTYLPYTVDKLMKRGVNPLGFEAAANRCFAACGLKDGKLVRSALYSSDETTQQFWNMFVKVHKVLFRGKEAA
jgi:hypothetical protein